MNFPASLNAWVRRRQIGGPLRLFVSSHRPLAFVGGQALLAAAPLLALLGWGDAERWAQRLSAPNAGDSIDAWLGDRGEDK